jgi:hypothetical protein
MFPLWETQAPAASLLRVYLICNHRIFNMSQVTFVAYFWRCIFHVATARGGCLPKRTLEIEDHGRGPNARAGIIEYFAVVVRLARNAEKHWILTVWARSWAFSSPPP